MSNNTIRKIVVFGSPETGRTGLISVSTGGPFIQRFREIEEIDYYTSITLTDDISYRLKIIDVLNFCSHERKLDKIQQSDGFLFIYDITRRDTLIALACEIERVYEVKGEDSGVAMVIAGNKCDLEDQREVSVDEGRLFADKYGCSFLEVSGKEGIGLEALFRELCVRMYVDEEDEEGVEMKGKKRCLVM
eukprot:TRINITY_DN5268_c0_g1_i1.p1 TRINITY_DN5268_c0_g1~~TRINITY_DN5268_c0_g1_i1.p1  ORF type:complete len:206 (-),score=29.52 TRINITY_DN5268_c0_g1_i1:21-590(-)